MDPTWRLTVDRDWQGRTLDECERVHLDLTLCEGSLGVAIDAPFHEDSPPPLPPGPREGLWEFEVVELFVAEGFPTARDRYREFEFSPHGHWLAWSFEGQRRRSRPDPAVRYQAEIEGNRWIGEASIELAHLPPAPWRWLACSLHGESERRFLTSATLPGPIPDFHQPSAFPLADTTRIAPRPLEAAYRATTYWVEELDPPLALRIGEASAALGRTLNPSSPAPAAGELSSDWAFLTAYNPGSTAAPEAENREQQRRLGDLLEARGYTVLRGRGESDSGTWAAEPSLLVVGIAPGDALQLARRFGQLAVVVGQHQAAPELLWTTP